MEAGKITRVLLPSLIFAGVVACSPPSTVSVPDPVDLTAARTWYGAVGPLIGARCAICHRADDIAPFPLETLEDVQGRLPVI